MVGTQACWHNNSYAAVVDDGECSLFTGHQFYPQSLPVEYECCVKKVVFSFKGSKF